MHRRTYVRALVTSGIVTAGVSMDARGNSVVQPAQAQSDNGWSQQAKLAADDGDSGDEFSISVTVSGDGTTAVIGAQDDENPNGAAAGSAYVFGRDGSSWTQQAKLIPDDGDGGDRLGENLAVSSDGTTAVIAAPSDDEPNGPNAGSAYVFSRDGGSWTQQAKLAASDGDEADRFGTSVAVSDDGTTAVIGAGGDEDPNGESGGLFGGSAYVFSRDSGSWGQQAKLAADDGEERDSFGTVSVSGDGTTAVIGANRDDTPNGEDAGSAYVFSRDDGSWSQQAKLTAEDGDGGDQFGGSVTVSSDGTIALVAGGGLGYVFSRDSGSWSQQSKLDPDDGDDDFGSVAVSGDGSTAVLGAPGDDNLNGTNAGSAYVFSRDGDSWNQQVKLLADDGDESDAFGFLVAVSDDGTTAVISALLDEDPNGEDAGSAYVFASGDGPDGNTATPASTTTPTPTETPISTESQTDSPTTTGGSGPGFGVVAGLVGLSSGILLWRSEREDD